MTTMTRTDEHSPSNFDPAEYEYVGTFDGWRDYRISEGQLAIETALRTALDHHGFEGGNWHRNGTCDHCGARMRYVVVYRHISGVHIATGETCADERFELPDRASFDRKALIGLAAAARVAAEKAASIAKIYAENPGLSEIFDRHASHDFIGDVARKLNNYGSISERQIAAVFRVAAKIDTVQAERAAEIKVPAPSGRVTFDGVVVSRKWKDSDFGGGFKLTIKVTAPDGGVWLAWVSEPGALTTERGDIVRMTATLTPSGNDPAFAFGKRPAKVSKIGRDEIAGTASSLD